MAKAAQVSSGRLDSRHYLSVHLPSRAGRSAAERQTGDSGIRINLQNLEQEV